MVMLKYEKAKVGPRYLGRTDWHGYCVHVHVYICKIENVISGKYCKVLYRLIPCNMALIQCRHYAVLFRVVFTRP